MRAGVSVFGDKEIDAPCRCFARKRAAGKAGHVYVATVYGYRYRLIFVVGTKLVRPQNDTRRRILTNKSISSTKVCKAGKGAVHGTYHIGAPITINCGRIVKINNTNHTTELLGPQLCRSVTRITGNYVRQIRDTNRDGTTERHDSPETRIGRRMLCHHTKILKRTNVALVDAGRTAAS